MALYVDLTGSTYRYVNTLLKSAEYVKAAFSNSNKLKVIKSDGKSLSALSQVCGYE